MFALEVKRTSLELVGLSTTVGASSADRPGVRIGDFGGQIEIAAGTRRPVATYVLIDELLAKEQVGPQFTPCVRNKKEPPRR